MMISYFKDENLKSKKSFKKTKCCLYNKTLDNFGVIATTSSSVTLSTTRSGLMVVSVSIVFVCGLTSKNKVLSKVIYV